MNQAPSLAVDDLVIEFAKPRSRVHKRPSAGSIWW